MAVLRKEHDEVSKTSVVVVTLRVKECEQIAHQAQSGTFNNSITTRRGMTNHALFHPEQ